MEASIAGHGLCVMPAFIARRHKALVPVLAREVFLRRTYYLVMPADSADAARVRAVRQFLHEQVASAQSTFLDGG
jgi:DNA-binding transcriptional LysR family regulator